MELFLLRIIILAIGSGAAAIQDAKTTLISDKITYAMIALGIIINLVELNWQGLVLGAIVFALGYLVYYLGKIGGGDVKLFTGIVFLMPFFNGKIFVISILVFSALLALVFYSAYFVSKYARKGINWKENSQNIKMSIVLGIVFFGLLAILFAGGFEFTALLFLIIPPITLGLLFMAFETGIRKNFFLRKIAIEKLEEDEVIAMEFLDEKTKKILGLNAKRIMGEKEKEKLKKSGIKEVLVYRGMPPFAPFIFAAIILVLARPELAEIFFI